MRFFTCTDSEVHLFSSEKLGSTAVYPKGLREMKEDGPILQQEVGKMQVGNC